MGVFLGSNNLAPTSSGGGGGGGVNTYAAFHVQPSSTALDATLQVISASEIRVTIPPPGPSSHASGAIWTLIESDGTVVGAVTITAHSGRTFRVLTSAANTPVITHFYNEFGVSNDNVIYVASGDIVDDASRSTQNWNYITGLYTPADGGTYLATGRTFNQGTEYSGATVTQVTNNENVASSVATSSNQAYTVWNPDLGTNGTLFVMEYQGSGSQAQTDSIGQRATPFSREANGSWTQGTTFDVQFVGTTPHRQVPTAIAYDQATNMYVGIVSAQALNEAGDNTFAYRTSDLSGAWGNRIVSSGSGGDFQPPVTVVGIAGNGNYYIQVSADNGNSGSTSRFINYNLVAGSAPAPTTSTADYPVTYNTTGISFFNNNWYSVISTSGRQAFRRIGGTNPVTGTVVELFADETTGLASVRGVQAIDDSTFVAVGRLSSGNWNLYEFRTGGINLVGDPNVKTLTDDNLSGTDPLSLTVFYRIA